jgi:2-polyprenyl-6-methoxyphenol hydroxylase-like FAD-dependent oxidoreductase
MQFHLNGVQPGDPAITPGANLVQGGDAVEALPHEVDVLIVGCGPAGLTLASQLSAFPGIHTCIVDQKPGPLQVGQADGIACRSMEMFEAFGFSEKVLKEAYWVNETCFWRPDPDQDAYIIRSSRIQDVEDGLSEMPHTILSQARVHDFFLETMRGGPRRIEPAYGRRLTDLILDPNDATGYPVSVSFERNDAGHEGQIETVRAQYVVGCDGAHSRVRKSLGHSLRGDSANKVWGVMDILAVTDFPDIRLKCAIQSAREGSILIIPREGGYLVRMYVELDSLGETERVADRGIKPEQLVAAAQRILHPFVLDVKEIAWWSAYEIGQRVSDSFDDIPDGSQGSRTPHVFIAGDACHTHSPKAGQGMNVSMADTFNLGWKLASVLQGRAIPQLLHTYSQERRAKAVELIEFDRDMAKLFAGRPKDGEASEDDRADPARFQQYFAKHGRYTAGVETRYDPSSIVGASTHQELAAGLVIGMRFHSTLVIRLADAKPVQLGHAIKADGRWRLFAFAAAEDPTAAFSGLAVLCDFLEKAPDSPIRRYTPAGADIDAVIDVRAILQQDHCHVDLSAMPAFLLPQKGKYGLIDYEKIFCPDHKSGHDIFTSRGIDRDQGCLLVIRPDQFIAHVLPLNATAELNAFFAGFVRPAN